MSLVLDSSAALAFMLADEQSPASIGLLDKITANGASVPSLWRLEIANSLSAAARRGRLSQADRNGFLEDLSQLDIRIDPQTDIAAWSATLGLADRFGLTLYDAAYLELALRRNLPLATLDKQLRDAGSKAGVTLIL